MRWSRQADERGGRYGGGGTRLILGPGQRGGNTPLDMLLRTASNVLRNSRNICVRRVYTTSLFSHIRGILIIMNFGCFQVQPAYKGQILAPSDIFARLWTRLTSSIYSELSNFEYEKILLCCFLDNCALVVGGIDK